MAGDHETSFAHIPNNCRPKWWKDPGLRVNVLHCMACCFCPFYLGYDQTLLAGLQVLPQWRNYFGFPTGITLGIVTAALFLPAIVFSFVGDFFCQRFGRKPTVFIGSALIIIGGIFNALSQNLGQFAGSRVIVGIGGAITKVAAPALLHEIAHPRLRATFGTLYYGFYHLGGLISAFMCIAGLYVSNAWGWRMPCLIQVLGPTIVVSVLLRAPESPRWLASKGRYEEARQIIVKHHANGKEDDALAVWEYGEIYTTMENEKLLNKSTYMDFFRTKGNRKRLWVTIFLGMGSNWVGNGILGYYLAPVLENVGIRDPLTITGVNAALAGWNMIASLTAGAYSEKMGRRFMWITSNAGMGFGFCFIMGFAAGFANTGNAQLGIAVVPFIFVVYGFYDLAWIALNYTYVAEFMPYNLRTKGLAIYITFNNLSNAFNQFVNPIALGRISWRYYAVYIAIDFIVAFVAWLQFPETRRMSIEEISLVFDYDTKGGREMAMAELHNRGGDKVHDEPEPQYVGDEEAGDKTQPTHVELQDDAARR